MCVRHSVLRHQLSSINNHPVLSKGFVVGASLHHFDGPKEPEDLEHPEDLDDAQHPVVAVAPTRLTVVEARLLRSELRSQLCLPQRVTRRVAGNRRERTHRIGVVVEVRPGHAGHAVEPAYAKFTEWDVEGGCIEGEQRSGYCVGRMPAFESSAHSI